jgi:signal transduction histidine kinase
MAATPIPAAVPSRSITSVPITPLTRWLRPAFGVVLGGALAVVELGYLVGGGAVFAVAAVFPPLRRRVGRVIVALGRRFVRLERWRLTTWLDHRARPEHAGARVLGYLLARSVVGVVSASVVVSGVFWGLVFASVPVMGWGLVGPHSGGFEWPMVVSYHGVITPGTVLMAGAGGLVLLYVTARCTLAFAVLERRLAHWLLTADTTAALERRIAELTTSRAEVVAAVNAERRRIERDLHDGVQQRLVALAMLLGRARRQSRSQSADDLIRQAHVASQDILDDLRAVAWSVYPSVLDALGLDAALAALVERTGVPVELTYDLVIRPPTQVETAAYFIVSEAVTNAVKHAAADRITVRVADDGDRIVVAVRDDGVGGADPTGGGLVGLARRVAALDGRFIVHSPAGGPTEIVAELPCG